jgi:hypothetical protein
MTVLEKSDLLIEDPTGGRARRLTVSHVGRSMQAIPQRLSPQPPIRVDVGIAVIIAALFLGYATSRAHAAGVQGLYKES